MEYDRVNKISSFSEQFFSLIFPKKKMILVTKSRDFILHNFLVILHVKIFLLAIKNIINVRCVHISGVYTR